MKDQVYDFIGNKIKSNVLRITIFAILFLVILDELYSLSKFIIKYNNLYDFGRMIRKTCNDSYTEYETERFQLMNNIVDIRLKNDNTFDRYNSIIFVIAVISILYIAYFFVFICTELAFDGILSNIMQKVLDNSFPTFSSVMSMAKISLVSFVYKSSIFNLFVNVIKSLLLVYLILIIPLFVLIKLNNNIDISPFKNDVKNILPHIIILLSILMLQFLSKNVSYFTFNMFYCLFILSFYIIYLIVGVYIQESKNTKKKNQYENSENYNMKYLSFSRNYHNDIQKTETDIISLFLKNIFGFNDVKINMNIDYNIDIDTTDNFEKQAIEFHKTFNTINVNNFKNIIFILFVLLLCILFIYFVLYFFKPNGFELYGIFSPDGLDKDVLYNFAFIPLLCLMITIFVITMTKEYNSFINKYMFYNPNNLYRRQLKNINDIFNNVLKNDEAKKTNNSVCKNTANAIHLTIYSLIFSGYDVNKLFIPEFAYVTKCFGNDYIDYSKINAYVFDYYIKNGTHNIFYENSQCTSVNNELLIVVMKNTIPSYSGSRLSQDDIGKLKESFQKKLKYCINNVLNNKTYNGKKKLEITNDFIHNNQIEVIKTELIEELSLDEDTTLLVEEITEEYLKYIETIYRYNIQTIQSLCKCNKIEDFTQKGYDKLMNELKDNINNKSNGEYSLRIKNNYIEHFTMLSGILLSNINKLLTTNIKYSDKNLKLAKYIINNFNFYQKNKSELFKKRVFDVVDTKSFIKNDGMCKYTDINDIQELIQIIKKSFEDIKQIFNDDKPNKNDEISIIIISIDENNNLLRGKRNNFVDVYKKKYYFDNNYNKQLIFDFKIQYIDSITQLNEKTSQELRTISTNTLVNIKSFKNIDIDKYLTEFKNILSTYESKYDTLNKITNDLYKNDFDNMNQGHVAEEISKKIAMNATDTSKSVYVVFVIYFLLIAIANIIH